MSVNRDTANKILYYLYDVENNVFIHNKPLSGEIQKDSDDVIIDENLNGIFIEAVEIKKKTQQDTILNSTKMKYNEIKEILQKFRNMEKYHIKENDLELVIAYTIDVEKAITLYDKRLRLSHANLYDIPFPTGRSLKNSLKRKFNSTFGLNAKNIAIEKASKLYEIYIELYILKNYENENEKDVNEFFKTNQLYKRLAKKFVLTQTGYTKYNENNIFSKDIEKIAELFYDVDIQDKIKKDIDKNVASDDEDINKRKIVNYIGFCNVHSEIVSLNKLLTDDDYIENLRVKIEYIKKQLDEIKFNNDDKQIIKKTLEKYKEYVLDKTIEKIQVPDEMLSEIFNEVGKKNDVPLLEYYNELKQEKPNINNSKIVNFVHFMTNIFSIIGGEANPTSVGGAKTDSDMHDIIDSNDDINIFEQTGGELSFNKEKRSSSNINFSLTEINEFIKYFKIITYNLKKIIAESIGNNKTINSFMNKYLNILIGEKIKDNLSETNDGVIEKYKKGIINPEFLTEKIGSIDSYNHLANTLMEKDNGIVKKVLDTLKSNKSSGDSGKINIIKFELIKNDLMNMVIEHVTNINIVKDIAMEDNLKDKLQERFQDKFNNKIGKTQREKEVSSETKQLLDSIFPPQFTDSKTIQNYKKHLRMIDDAIDELDKKKSLTFTSVFNKIQNDQIFNNLELVPSDNSVKIKIDGNISIDQAETKNGDIEQIKQLLTRLSDPDLKTSIKQAIDGKSSTEQLKEIPPLESIE